MLEARLALPDDRDAAVKLVGDLLAELGGNPPPPDALAPVYDRLIAGGTTGFIAVGEDESGIVAVCTVSYLEAMRTRGRYAIVQEMFVEPGARSTGVGHGRAQLCLAARRGQRLRNGGAGAPRIMASGRFNSIAGPALPRWARDCAGALIHNAAKRAQVVVLRQVVQTFLSVLAFADRNVCAT